ncbi:ABC transporter, ATP-binding protein [Isosphaera pallida ATCC 43644]|uniref:ABC transporter, ATP-binding protein n=1 Tax=Isosphaera pallida (strain ATCC 43644 / DSM 9630 / IS1B) TaxID=575540 RepID=E8R3X7_ISOPI|nr:ABC transporter, ATP-binding protein [Isosphaera pallida ATCC 43644]
MLNVNVDVSEPPTAQAKPRSAFRGLRAARLAWLDFKARPRRKIWSSILVGEDRTRQTDSQADRLGGVERENGVFVAGGGIG